MSGRHRLVWAAFYPSNQDLGRRVTHGAAWLFGFTALRVLLTMGSTAVLARLLSPTDYGLVAMSSIVVELAALVTNLGFGSILVQKLRLTRLDLDSTFWASFGVGVALTLIVWAAAFPAALFFKQPTIIGILWVSALNFIIQEATVVPNAILNRLLLFKADVLIQMAQMVIRLLLTILMAWLGAGYWSLVVAPLIAGVIGNLALLWYVGYAPRLRFNKAFIAHNWRASGSYFGSGMLSYLLSNFDYMVVGRRFGPQSLGYYQMAFSLAEELRSRLSGPLQRVLFPAYSLLQNDLDAFRKGVARSQRVLSIIVLPLGVGLAITADEVVRVLYGEKWLPVVPLLQILAVGGATRAMFSLVASIYYARGRPDLAFKISIFLAPFVLAGIFIGSHWGVEGVAWAMVLVQLPSFFAVHIAMRLIDSSAWVFYRTVLPALFTTLFMASILLAIRHLSGLAAGAPALRLGILVSVGAVSYAGFLFFANRALALEIIGLVKQIASRSR